MVDILLNILATIGLIIANVLAVAVLITLIIVLIALVDKTIKRIKDDSDGGGR